MIAKTIVVAFALSGCSLGMRKPLSRIEPDGCSLYDRPVGDSILAAGFALGGVLWIRTGPYEHLEGDDALFKDKTTIRTRAELTLLPAALFTAAATYGYVMAARCSCAHRHQRPTPTGSR